ncbi:UDP-N-acetylmuramoyl-tripeptide--D-alanyl-D-alanine ligase [Kangiella sp. TOML190]|uniref:UDP-N-acetylmuramoyl-tripeptide--D-alanyl-D- alanine ligase n=1 Tax=Kangiella sp. TOML190 TaxID=2931351 RepID=UPI00203D08FE|nr:UDP-N-acetylmuramoyl-tripeptide--D-alanyl-D-alanine ligase [Kangiella sp. TOML190]
MIKLSLKQVCQAVNGQLVGDDLTVSEVFTDTRVQAKNSLFVALVGENFDAHDFIEQAEQQGAIALLVSKPVATDLPQVVAKNTETALGQLANLVRTIVNPKVVGITGSAGKTSVKEMLAAILLQAVETPEQVLATQGNFNNHIGVPLTLLRLTGREKFAVIEMGANHQGEIAYCADIAKPNVTVVNNVAPAHIEGFGSVQGVAIAKGEIYQALAADGCAVVNLDSDFSEEYLQQLEQIGCQKLTVSRHNIPTIGGDNALTHKAATQVDIWAEEIALNEQGNASFELSILDQKTSITLVTPGIHQVSNALVAAALATSLEISVEAIKAGLEAAGEVKGRLNRKPGLNGSLIIDDTYNASVASVKVAIDLLSGLSGVNCLVLGDMAELGDESELYHREVGAYAKQKALSALYAWGDFSRFSVEAFGANGSYFSDKQGLISELKNSVTAEHNILVKGSRSARMEQVVDALVATTESQNQDEHHLLGGGDPC